ENLAEFAVMGSVFAQVLLGLDKPKVGVLNVGSEELKGHEELRQAAGWLRRDGVPVDFQGFVEGNDIGTGNIDVVVADGFTGNVALKAIEGTAKLYTQFVRDAFRTSTFAQIGYLFASGAWVKLRKRVDPRRYNGGVFLGLDGVCVKSHGGTDALGFAYPIGGGGPGKAAPGDFDRRGADNAGAAGKRRGRVIRSVVQGCGAYLPERVVTNDELAKKIETSDEWIQQRTGIKQRHIAADGEFTSHLAIKASERALAHAGVKAPALDLIVLATATPDETFPATATRVQAALG